MFELVALVGALFARALKEIPAVLEAIRAGDATAQERLNIWLGNQPEMVAEAKRTDDIVAAAKGRLGTA